MEEVYLKSRPTVAVIDKGAVEYNYRAIKKGLPKTVRVMAIVKANAYGHGDVEVARILEPLGCDMFGVAIPEEGIRLRENRIRKPIIVLGGFFPGQENEVIKYGLTPVLFELPAAKSLDKAAKKAGITKKFHLKIDTGMCRLGILPHEALDFCKKLKSLKNIQLEGVLSHFAEAEAEKRGFSIAQLKAFLETVDIIRGLGFNPKYIDMANSAATIKLKEARLNLVRPGLMLYGAYPGKRLQSEIELKPAMTLKTRIMRLKEVPAGYSVSYGRTFVTRKKSLIATLPIGYADGLSRQLSNKGTVLIRGKRAPIRGVVCMDLVMCDVTGIKGVSAGDEAIIIGKQGKDRITAEEMAEKAGTISYEVFCNISKRVPRVFV